jgi:hypothetical protein
MAGIFEDQKGMASGKRVAGFIGLWMIFGMVKRGFLYPSEKDISVNMNMFYAVLGFVSLCFGLAMLEWFAMIKEKKDALLADVQKPESVKLAEVKVQQTIAEKSPDQENRTISP